MEHRDLPVAAALVALSASVGLAFGRVFDDAAYLAPVLAAAVLPHALGLVARRFGWAVPIAWGASAAALGVFALVRFGGGSVTALADRLAGGWRIVEHDVVPLPATDGTVLLAAIIVWVAATVGDDLAFRRQAALGALAPGAMILIWVTALGESDDQLGTVAVFGVVAVVFLALQHQRLLHRRRTALGEARPVDAPGLVVLGLVAGLVAVGLGITAAPALPGGDEPLFEPGGGPRDGRDETYRTQVPPLLDVGDKLRRGTQQELFTVRASAPEYWRITALDEYRSVAGGQWTLTAEGADAVGEGLDEEVPEDALRQEYVIGPLDERWMPAAYKPVRISREGTLVVRASSTLVTTEASVTGQRYRVQSALPPSTVTDAQRERAGAAPPPELLDFTELPDDFPESVRAEAAAITAGMTSAFDKAQALRDFFRDGSFTYDPTIELGDDEATIVRFLQERRGFCVQFASAYATMARSVGLPTRVAVGFTPGTPGADGAFHVTNWDAHAWPEVWLAGLGWTHLFDPTPPSAEPGGSALPSEPDVGPPATQPAPVPPVTTPVPATPEPSAPAPGEQPAPTPTIDRSADTSATDDGAPWIVVIAVALAAAFAAPLVSILLLKRRRRARRRSAADPSDAVEGAWHETLDELLDRRVPVPASDTPRELAARVPAVAGTASAAPMHDLAESYGAVHYGGRPASRGDADAAWRNVALLRAALDTSSGLGARLRARIDPSRLRRTRV